MEIALNRDQAFESRPNGSSNFNRNIMISKRYNTAVNEDGITADCIVAGKDIMGVIPTTDELIIFSTDGVEGEIGRCKDGVYTCVIKDSGLNFLMDNPIQGHYTLNFKQEIIVVWWDGLGDTANPPRIFNIDCPPFELNLDCTLVNPLEIEELFLSPTLNCPEISVTKVADTGGQLESGVYTPFIAYKFSDGSYSNYVAASNWITIYEDKSIELFEDIRGCDAGTLTSKLVTLRLSSLNTNFTHLALGFISKIGGILSAFVFKEVRITAATTTFNLSSKEGSEDVALEEILIPSVSFQRVHTGADLNNKLYLSNVKTLKDFDYQPYANNIKAEWVRVDTVNLALYPNSYKDVVFINEKRGFSANEVYALYVGFRLKDGTFSKFFHIPARAPGLLPAYGNLPETSRIADMVTAGFPPTDAAEFVAISSDARYHEVYSTALQTGEMGVFVNQNEAYEDKDCWDIKNAAGTITGTLRNTSVRHHRFPDFNQLAGWGSPIYTPSTGSAYDVYLVAGPANFVGSYSIAGSNNLLDFNVATINGAFLSTTVTTDQLVITCTAAFTGEVEVDLRLLLNNSFDAVAYILRASGVDEQLVTGEGNGNVVKKAELLLYYKDTVSFEVGDKLIVESEIAAAPIIFKPQSYGNIIIKVNNYSGSNGTTTALGLKFTDINIPAEIKDQIECVHFAYAVRTELNSLKVATGRVEKYFDAPQTKLNFSDYSIILKKPALGPAYARVVYYLNKPSVNSRLGVDINGVFMTYALEAASRQIDNSQYLPKDVSIPVNNKDLEETYLVELVNPFTVITPMVRIRVVDLYNYAEDVYLDFTNQVLALIPTPLDKNATTTGTLYSGDTFIMAAFDVLVQDSKDNLGLMYNRTIPLESEYPFDYNSDYTSIQNLLSLQIDECKTECDIQDINTFPYKIYKSQANSSESTAFSWRRFLNNDVYEMPDRHKGAVWKLSSYNRALLIHQEYSLFIALDKDKLAANLTEVFLGTGDLFDRKPEEALPTQEGYAGCQSLWGAIVTKLGYIFVDKIQGKVFIFNGKLNEISNLGLNNFFKATLNYEGEEDNPFYTNGITLGYDERNARILLSRIEREGSTILPSSYTYSFSEQSNSWIAEHDYIASVFTRTLKEFFSLNNDSVESRLYNHTKINGKGLFYRGVRYESYVEILFNQDNPVSKRWDSIIWATDVESLDSENIYYEETATHVLAYNQYQCTGKIPIIALSKLAYSAVNTRHLQHNWFFNRLKDVVITKSESFIDNRGVIDNSKFNNSKSWFDKSNFFSKFIVVRLVIDNIAQRHVYIKTLAPGDTKTNLR
jgi:hypothetical protein